MKPSVGRIVHYKRGGECHAAIVIDARPDGRVRLKVFFSHGNWEESLVTHEEGNDNGTWHWPERVE